VSKIHRLIMSASGNHSLSHRGSVPQAPTMRTEVERDLTHIVASNNDGFEVWFGYPNKWNHHIDQREASRLFWWLLFRWYGQARWFGIRRPLYYWALRGYLRSVPGIRMTAPSTPVAASPLPRSCASCWPGCSLGRWWRHERSIAHKGGWRS